MELPSLYTSANSKSRRDTEELYRAFIPRMQWDYKESVLDIGCGSGDITRDVLLPMLPSPEVQLVGADISQKMIEFASENFSNKYIKYHLLNIEAKENPRKIFPGGFSKIFSAYCLHWVSDHASWVKNIHSLLRPSGEAFVIFSGSIETVRTYEPMSMMPEWTPYMEDVSNFISEFCDEKEPAKLLERTAKDVGFEVLTCEAQERTFIYKSVDDLRRLIASVSPFMSRIPEKMQKKYIEDSAEIMRTESRKGSDSDTTTAYTLLVAHLRKPE